MKIVCFGDSNTFGFDPRGFLGGRYDEPWPQILAARLNCAVVNLGENGREIPDGPPDLPADADLLIVMLGTNDLLQGASAEAVCGRMAHFLKTLDPGMVFLIAPPPMVPGTWVPRQQLITGCRALALGYRALAARLGIRFADAGDWDLPMAYDGVHLTGEGHRAFAGNLYKELTSQCGSSFLPPRK